MDKKFLSERKKAIKEIATATDAIKLHLKYIERLANQYGIRVELDGFPRTGYDGDAWYVPELPEELRTKLGDGEEVDLTGTDWEESAEYDAYDQQYGWKNSSSYC
jgi:hypothetical protein